MRKNLLVLATFTLLAIVVTWPLLLHFNTLIIDRYDGLLITWILNWDIHSLTGGLSGLRNFYEASIFFPYHQTLAFSDLQLPLAVLALPFVLFFKEPLVAYNVNFLFGFILTGFSTYLLTDYFTKNKPVAFFTSILFAFSVIHLNYMTHLQLFNFWPVILTIYFLFREKFFRFFLFFVLAGLTTALNIYFILLVAGVYFFLYPKSRRKVLLATSAGVVVSGIFLFPYFLVSREFHYVRPITDAIHFSLQIPQLLSVSSASRLYNLFKLNFPGTQAFPGVGLSIWIGYFLYQLLKNGRRGLKASGNPVAMFLVVAIISFILSLGPALHFFPNTVHIGPIKAIPLPYTILYYLLPGFSGLRTPSRWILLTFFSLTIASSIYLARRTRKIYLLLLSTAILLEINFPFRYQTVPALKDFPPEQMWLKTHYPNAPLIQFPIYGWWNPSTGSRQAPSTGSRQVATNGLGLETLREYYSTVHWHPMFNGYSGFSPREWEEKVKWLQNEFPSDETIKYLQNQGIKLILIPRGWTARMTAGNELQLVKEFPETSVYYFK